MYEPSAQSRIQAAMREAHAERGRMFADLMATIFGTGRRR